MVFPEFKQQQKEEEKKFNPSTQKLFDEAEKVVLISFGTIKRPKNESMAEIFKAITLTKDF